MNRFYLYLVKFIFNVRFAFLIRDSRLLFSLLLFPAKRSMTEWCGATLIQWINVRKEPKTLLRILSACKPA